MFDNPFRLCFASEDNNSMFLVISPLSEHFLFKYLKNKVLVFGYFIHEVRTQVF